MTDTSRTKNPSTSEQPASAKSGAAGTNLAAAAAGGGKKPSTSSQPNSRPGSAGGHRKTDSRKSNNTAGGAGSNGNAVGNKGHQSKPSESGEKKAGGGNTGSHQRKASNQQQEIGSNNKANANNAGGHSRSNSNSNSSGQGSGRQGHRKTNSASSQSGSAAPNRPPVVKTAPAPTSTLNPNAGGFQPGALQVLGEVENEVLITPIVPSFDSSVSGGDHQANGQNMVGGFRGQNFAGGFAGDNGDQGYDNMAGFNNGMNGLNFPGGNAALQANLQALQNMQNQVQNIQNLQNLQQQQQQAQQLPPRFASQQQQQQQQLPNNGLVGNGGMGDVGGFMAEQMAIQAQLEQLRQQQEDLIARFGGMQMPGNGAQMPGVGGNAALEAMLMNNNNPLAGNQGNRGAQQQQGGHRRHLSQQVTSGGGGGGGGFGGGSMGQFGAGQNVISGLGGNNFAGGNNSNNNFGGQGSNMPKGHGRRHSVNVINKSAANNQGSNSLSSSPALSNTMSPPMSTGSSVVSPQMGFGGNQAPFGFNQQIVGGFNNVQGNGELDFGGGSGSGFVPGHGRRESRNSISSLSGWGGGGGGFNSNNVVDLAQAQAQLQQLAQFRASSGHGKVPSFGMNNQMGVMGIPGNMVGQFGGNFGSQGNQQQMRKSLFSPYLPAASIPPLVAAGQLVLGTLRVNKRNRSDAYVATEVLDSDIYICGSKDRNRALEGDIVAVELLDVDEVWGTKKEKEEKKRKKEENAAYDPKASQNMRKQDKKKDDVEVEGQGLMLFEDEEVTDEQKPTYAGHVVAVVERLAGQLFSGTLGLLRPSSAATKEKQEADRREKEGVDLRGGDDRNKIDRPKIIWFKPTDKRVPLIAIPTEQAPADFVEFADRYADKLFVACIKRWPITSLHPFGTLVEELGTIGDIETETQALLKDCNFSTEDFSESVLKCLPPTPWAIPDREIELRKDFREKRVFTIDPQTAKDLDDALHITKDDEGNYEIGVHIADVTHFVKPNTALDREARKRATTVYLVQRAYPMLPSSLSEELCSLSPGEDKLTFSVVFKMTPDAKLISTWYGKGVIKSCAKLAYENAQEVIDGKPLPKVEIHNNKDADGIEEDVKTLNSLARQLRARRFDSGALKIDQVKLSFKLDENGLPDDCQPFQRREANEMIEEFMLLANISVAQKIAANLSEQALLRRHESPIDRRLAAFAERAKRLGFQMDTSSAGALMASLTASGDTQSLDVLQLLATKSMLRARYFCAGSMDISKYSHYALNVPLYTHFTSPIRRYADVIVHRQLESALLGPSEPSKFTMDTDSVAKIAATCNTKKDASKLAQEQSQHLFLCVLISDLTQKFGPVVRPAFVVGVLDEAFDVLVPEFGIEKRVHVDQMPIDNHVYDEHTNTLEIYWKKGVDVVHWLAEHNNDAHLHSIRRTAEHHAKLMEASSRRANDEAALFDDDDDEQILVQPEGTGITPTSSVQRLKSMNKAKPQFEGIRTTPAGHCVQRIAELQTVPVIVTADMTKSPPVVRVCSVNPFQSA